MESGIYKLLTMIAFSYLFNICIISLAFYQISSFSKRFRKLDVKISCHIGRYEFIHTENQIIETLSSKYKMSKSL